MKPKTLIYSISLFIFTITQFQLSAQSVQIPPESYIAKCKEWADALNAHDVKPYQLACFEEILWLLRHPKYKPNLEDMPTHSYIATMVYFKKDNKIYNEFNVIGFIRAVIKVNRIIQLLQIIFF